MKYKNSFETSNERRHLVFIESVSCPHCSAEVEVKLEASIDAQDPKQVKKLLDKSLFLKKCKKCGKTFLTEHCFTYQDERKSIQIACSQNSLYTADIVRCMLDGRDELTAPAYHFARVVTTFKEFKEKYTILDAGLDDRVIELIKLDVRENQCADCGKIKEIICTGVNERRIALRVVGDKKAKAVYITHDEYLDWRSKYMRVLVNHVPVVIDESWAIENAI